VIDTNPVDRIIEFVRPPTCEHENLAQTKVFEVLFQNPSKLSLPDVEGKEFIASILFQPDLSL
jgi:hypothetical protein